MRLAFVLAALFVAGCKDTPKPAPQPAQGSAQPVSKDPHGALPPPTPHPRCDISALADTPHPARPAKLLETCKPCGDWTPIVMWNTPSTAGGPKRADIETAMQTCNAYCLGDAKDKFLGTLDDARGRSSRTPWKQLAVVCRERISAVPDDRFVDGVYFALDRIARTLGDQKMDIPLPPVSVSGVGVPLPRVTRELRPPGTVQVSVIGTAITVGSLPRATLSKDGIAVDLGSDGYPGKTVTLEQLPEVLGKAAEATLIAPQGMPADKLVPVIRAAKRPLFLAARAKESPEGWDLPAVIPVPLDAARVTSGITVQQLAEKL